MTPLKRPRGRPLGSGKDDAPHLSQVADLLVCDSSLRPTTAMRRVMRERNWTETDETLIRRWQFKWKRDRSIYMAAAHKRSVSKASQTYIASFAKSILPSVELSQAIQRTFGLRMKFAEQIKAPAFLEAVKGIAEAQKNFCASLELVNRRNFAFAEAMKRVIGPLDKVGRIRLNVPTFLGVQPMAVTQKRGAQ